MILKMQKSVMESDRISEMEKKSMKFNSIVIWKKAVEKLQ